MSDTAIRLYEHFKTERQFFFSNDPTTKNLEMDAVNELESGNYITVKMRTIGYVIAEIS